MADESTAQAASRMLCQKIHMINKYSSSVITDVPEKVLNLLKDEEIAIIIKYFILNANGGLWFGPKYQYTEDIYTLWPAFIKSGKTFFHDAAADITYALSSYTAATKMATVCIARLLCAFPQEVSISWSWLDTYIVNLIAKTYPDSATETTRRNLVFTSVGPNSKFHKTWTEPNQNYDIYIIYYGDDSASTTSTPTLYEKYKAAAKWAEKRKGSKFQNFHYFYNTYPDIISAYDRFFILDDDIIISPSDISRMFDISYKYNLSICGPSFSEQSIAFHPITHNRPNTILQYTNFVEVNTPLFSSEALKKFMKYYDGTIIGAGLDYLYIWANDKSATTKFAIVHDVQCVNPSTQSKGLKTRELYGLKEDMSQKKSGTQWEIQRWSLWQKYAEKIKCPHIFGQTIYGTLTNAGELITRATH
jgi:hypothetical protein